MVLAYSTLYRLPEGRCLNSLCAGCEGSEELLLAHFLTLDQYRSWVEGRSTPMILSADLIVRFSLFLSYLMVDPSQTVMEVVRTDWMMASLSSPPG